MKKLLTTVVASSFLLMSCSHEKVATHKLTDANLSCHQIVAETSEMKALLKDINGKTGFSGRNVGMGLVFWPGIFVNQMNAGEAENLANKRVSVLAELYSKKGCGNNKAVVKKA
ncbi:MAG: hypothetical protein RLN62_04330 [Rickettsiales bacterium]